MDENFDIESLRLPDSVVNKVAPKRAAIPPRHKRGDKFLKGPIPMSWLKQAATLPGRSLEVGLMLWHLSGLSKKRTVKFSLSRMEELNVNYQAARRGLRSLEHIGLITIEHRPGQSLLVTLLDVSNERT